MVVTSGLNGRTGGNQRWLEKSQICKHPIELFICSTTAKMETQIFSLSITRGGFIKAEVQLNFWDVWNFLLQIGIKQYIFGSFKVEATKEQMMQLHDTFHGGKIGGISIEVSEVFDLEVWDYDLDRISRNPDLLGAALKCRSDTEATHQFIQDFNSLFVMTEKTGAIKVNQSDLLKVEVFMVRYGQFIKNMTGMFNYVPKFNLPSPYPSNSMEMMKCFVTAFPAYVQVCRNNQIPKHIRWNFDIVIQ